jgi:hypothetical protein
MSNVRLSAATRNAMLNALRDRIDAGGAGGTIKIYTGLQPVNSDEAVTDQTLLAVLTFSYPSAPDAASGVLTFGTITEEDAALASGMANWARLADSNGNTVTDCDVGTTAATLILGTTSVTAGAPVRINSGSFSLPG